MKKNTLNVKSYIAEFIGTCVLVVFGCGTAAGIGCDVTGGYLATALAFGLVIVAMAYSIGNISGCHINPAVSLAMFINKKLSLTDFIGYLISQFLGGLFGSLLLLLFFDRKKGLGANGLYNENYWLSILIEVILTFVFIFAILGVTSKSKNAQVTGIVIGLTLTLVHILGIHFTGTSVNPARSFGPAVFAGGEYLRNVWVFFVGPFLGSALAAYAWKFIGNKDE